MGRNQGRDVNERVIRAAEAVLEVKGYVSPIDLLAEMRWLQPSQVKHWEKGRSECLEDGMQSTPERRAQAFLIFTDWAERQSLVTVRAALRASGRDGSHDLRVTSDADPDRETFFRTYYAPADITPRKLEALKKKLNKPPDLVVFKTVADDAVCAECKAEIPRGDFIFREQDQSLCLRCADLDHLEFLPSGDAALSRRSKKHSPLSAVVVQFNRRARRYERRGILVTAEAIAQAERECLSDADRRAAQRERGAERRKAEDATLVRDLAGVVLRLYPGCPADEAERIAAHTARRGSGRVGRSAAGRNLREDSVRLAVIAHIRHEHTGYDDLLMTGTPRQDARRMITARIDKVLAAWGTDR